MLRVLLIIGLLLFVLPIVISLGLLGLGMASQFWVAAAILHAMGMIENTPVKKEWNVVNVRQHSQLTESYRTIVEPKKLLDERSVTLNAILGIEDVPGGRNANLEAENAIKIYAPQFATEECTRLKQVLADQCVIESTRVSARENNLFDVSIQINYTMKESFGQVAEKTPLMVAVVTQNLVEGGMRGGRLITRSGQTEARMAMYRRAAAACQQVRSMRGNCGLTTLQLRASSERNSTSALRLAGEVRLVYLQKQ